MGHTPPRVGHTSAKPLFYWAFFGGFRGVVIPAGLPHPAKTTALSTDPLGHAGPIPAYARQWVTDPFGTQEST